MNSDRSGVIPERVFHRVCDERNEAQSERNRYREALVDATAHPIDSAENLKARIRARRLLDGAASDQTHAKTEDT